MIYRCTSLTLFVLEWTVNELGLMHCGAKAWMDDFHAVRIGDSERE